MSQNDVFQQSRAHLLLAKCIVASTNPNAYYPSGKFQYVKISEEEKRVQIGKAIRELKKAKEGFSSVQAHHRVKDVLYMMVRFLNSIS